LFSGVSFTPLWARRALLWQLARREVAGRYRGAFLGFLWPLLTPLLMLVIYGFVFGSVFKARWQGGDGDEGLLGFVLPLFAGLIVFNLFAECVTRAPSLISSNPNFVRKVVFPLDVLPLSVLLAALFHAGLSLAVLLGALAIMGRLEWTALWLPVIWAPFLVFLAGASWWLASVGVFVRDLAQVMGMVTTAILFLSPVFYPATALPEGVREWLFLNPLALPIEQTRAVLIWGQSPDWGALGLYALAAGFGAWAGLAWFQGTRRGFADVL